LNDSPRSRIARSTIADVEARYRNGGIGYGEVKAQLAEQTRVGAKGDSSPHRSAS
jgi:hypothetical protein